MIGILKLTPEGIAAKAKEAEEAAKRAEAGGGSSGMLIIVIVVLIAVYLSQTMKS